MNKKIIRAAEYVRMSTEHQKYSTANQSEAIHLYAKQNNMEIVRTYSDAGKSGLSIQGRSALRKLIDDVENGEANFDAVLVYDVSRWGRFQDADESAYYEYICKSHGISVHYCAEQFSNDGSPVATIVKGVKRAMAGEYSRELSSKVFAGQSRLIELGYRQGGMAGFGLRRMRIDQNGNHQGILEIGQRKSLQTDRVILVPGPEEEVKTVNWMFHQFVETGKSESEIAVELNLRDIKTDLGRSWTKGTVHQILTNEKYIGNNVYNKQSFKLKRKRIKNEPDIWIRSNHAFEGIVEPTIFWTTQGIIQERNRRYTDEEMLTNLKNLFDQHGYLSGIIIDENQNAPCSGSYQRRFGSLIRAYELIGFKPDRDYRYIEINRALRRFHSEVLSNTESSIRELGGDISHNPTNDLLTINNEFTASVIIARCHLTQAGSLRWKIRLDTGLLPDITVAIRMNQENTDPLDYYLLPHNEIEGSRLRLAEQNGFSLDAFRFQSLQYFFEMAKRIQIMDIAA